jgi:filamentous hemagglutinin
MIRDIAGGHLFDNGNKRTAVEVVEQLIIKKRRGWPAKTNYLECCG